MTMIMTTYTGVGSAISITLIYGLIIQLVHSTVIQWLIYGNHPNIITTTGILLIVICGLVAAVSLILQFLLV